MKYTYNQEDIEDNYVEALVNFYKYMDSYDPARPVKTWLYGIFLIDITPPRDYDRKDIKNREVFPVLGKNNHGKS